MTSDVEAAEARVEALYRQFKNDPVLEGQLNEYRPITETDERHDEVYRSEESYLDVSMKAKLVEGYGDVNYGLRVRLSDEEGLERVRTLLSQAGHEPSQVITDISERIGYTEVTIEFADILDIAADAS